MLQSKTINSSLSLYVWSALNSLALILQQTSTICNMQVLQFYGNSIYIILFIANRSRNSIVSLYFQHVNTHALYCNAFKCFCQQLQRYLTTNNKTIESVEKGYQWKLNCNNLYQFEKVKSLWNRKQVQFKCQFDIS